VLLTSPIFNNISLFLI